MSRWSVGLLGFMFVVVAYLLGVVGQQHTELVRLRELRDSACSRPEGVRPVGCNASGS